MANVADTGKLEAKHVPSELVRRIKRRDDASCAHRLTLGNEHCKGWAMIPDLLLDKLLVTIATEANQSQAP